MKIKRSWLASGIIVGSFVLSLGNSGCSDDDDDNASSARLSRKGEACQTSADCAAGLACLSNSMSFGGTSSSGSIALGGTCVIGVYGLAPAAKECARIACTTAQDCCDLNKSSGTQSYCDSLKDLCEGPNPDQITCESYKTTCTCDETRIGCEAGTCIQKCVDDGACTGYGPKGGAGKCLGGKCGQCSADTDCKSLGDDQVCVNAKCQAPCKGDGDCAGLDRCVGGKCVQGGCQSSRECVALTRKVESTCGTDGKCITPCQTDPECNPGGFRFNACVNNQCTYLGCESDKDCKLQFDPDGSEKTVSYVCRDKGIPGNLVVNP